MNEIMGWIKNIFCVSILLTAVYQVMPQNSYLKYVRIFGGIVLAVLVMQPVLYLFGPEADMEQLLKENTARIEFNTAKAEVGAMLREKESYFRARLEEEYGSEILDGLENWGEPEEVEEMEETPVDHSSFSGSDVYGDRAADNGQ